MARVHSKTLLTGTNKGVFAVKIGLGNIPYRFYFLQELATKNVLHYYVLVDIYLDYEEYG